MFEKNLLAGRTILITGGGTGLGRSMSLRMAGLGAKMFLVGRREEPLREVAEEIRAAPPTSAIPPWWKQP
jgi:citronellol/citronellal dehydrogenase